MATAGWDARRCAHPPGCKHGMRASPGTQGTEGRRGRPMASAIAEGAFAEHRGAFPRQHRATKYGRQALHRHDRSVGRAELAGQQAGVRNLR